MPLETVPFDAAAYLESPMAQAELLEEAFQSGEASHIAAALGVVARARGMTQVARDAGITREALYKTLSADGWEVVVVWECSLRPSALDELTQRILIKRKTADRQPLSLVIEKAEDILVQSEAIRYIQLGRPESILVADDQLEASVFGEIIQRVAADQEQFDERKRLSPKK